MLFALGHSSQAPNKPTERLHATVVEQMVLALGRHGVTSLLAALARLLDRRELKSNTVVLLDFFYQLSRGQDPLVLFKAHKRVTSAAVASSSSASSKSGKTSSYGSSSSNSGGNGSRAAGSSSGAKPAAVTTSALLKSSASGGKVGKVAVVKTRPSTTDDPLRQMLKAQQNARESSLRQRSIATGSGDMRAAYVLGGYGSSAAGGGAADASGNALQKTAIGIGTGRTVSSIFADRFRAESEAARAPAMRRGGRGRKSKHELPEAPLTLDIRSGIGASLSIASGGHAGAAAGGGSSSASFSLLDSSDVTEMIDPAREVSGFSHF